MSLQRCALAALVCSLSACGGEPTPLVAALALHLNVNGDSTMPRDTDRTAPTEREGPPTPQPPRRRVRAQLSPDADSIANALTLAPLSQTWFTAAARGKRLVIDIGRSDVRIGSSPARVAAFQEAVRSRTPLPVGTRVRVYGPWGADDVVVTGFAIRENRVVALLGQSPRVDSIARRVEPLLVAARRADSATASRASQCSRAPIDSALAERADVVRDSVARAIMAAEMPVYERLEQSLRVAGSRLSGCFGPGRVLLIISVRAGGFDWVRERFVLVAENGAVHPLETSVYRHRAHDGVAALDADGDGVDDVAARVLTDGAGALTILRLEEGKRLVPLTSGFAWEY